MFRSHITFGVKRVNSITLHAPAIVHNGCEMRVSVMCASSVTFVHGVASNGNNVVHMAVSNTSVHGIDPCAAVAGGTPSMCATALCSRVAFSAATSRRLGFIMLSPTTDSGKGFDLRFSYVAFVPVARR